MNRSIVTIIFFLSVVVNAFGQRKTAQISGKLNFLNDGDTVILYVFKYGGLMDYDPLTIKIMGKVSNHSFHLKTELDQYLYCGLRFVGKDNANISNLILSPGDDIHITGEKRNYRFSGTNSESFTLQSQIRKRGQEIESLLPRSFKPGTLKQYFAIEDSVTTVSLAILDKYKSQIKTELFEKLRLGIVYGNKWWRVYELITYGQQYIDSVSDPFKKPYLTYIENYSVPGETPSVSKEFKGISPFYCEWVYRKYEVDSCVLKKEKFSVHKCFRFYMENFDGLVREELIARLFIAYKNHTQEDIGSDIAAALSFMKNEDLIKILQKIASSNIIGVPAYDFSLTGLNGETIRLNSFKGKVVVLDFWFTGCGACRELAPELFILEKKYEGKDIAFLSICTDKNRDQWHSSVNSQVYSSPLSVNLFTEGKGDAHPVVNNYGVRGFPTLIVIDKEGKIGTSTDKYGHDAAIELDQIITKYLGK